MEKQKPTVTPMPGLDCQRIEHPAFGRIKVSHVQTSHSGISLFNSALTHSRVIRIQIQDAAIDRQNHHDWLTGKGEGIVEFYMSESQWAQFVASAGEGEGTPVTFTRKPESVVLRSVPQIEHAESMKQTHAREAREACDKALEQTRKLLEDVALLRAAGKAGKGQLIDIENRLMYIAQGLPSSIECIQKSLAETMEKTVDSGKAEIESFITQTALATGMDIMRAQFPLAPQLPDTKE